MNTRMTRVFRWGFISCMTKKFHMTIPNRGKYKHIQEIHILDELGQFVTFRMIRNRST